MNNFQPELTIHASDAGAERTYRFAFYMPRGDNYIVRCKTPVLVARVDDSLEVRVDPLEGESQLVVSIGTSGDGNKRVDLAHIGFVDNAAMPEGFALDLLDAVQRALFKAMGALVPTVAAAAVGVSFPGARDAGREMPSEIVPATGWRSKGASAASFAKRNLLVGSVLLIGLAFAGYGAYTTYIAKTQGGITSDIVGTTDYADLQEKIRKQITEAAKSGSPALNGANGQNMSNVAIETMRAMGLDPGKANAGCLVGVKP